MKRSCNDCKAPRVDDDDLHCPYCRERDQLRVENKRLREALGIIEGGHSGCMLDKKFRCQHIARAALGKE